ncbi:MAG: T9SS type A sorting domain-containing protein [Ignavibacteriae bacterium]|nr:T9SS type A sorting domain-containing protein [Ignavibacteriota bacterium]
MKKEIKITLAFLLFLSASNIFSQSGWIRQSPVPYQFSGYSIKLLNNNTGFCVGQMGNIIKTTNGGINWNSVNSNTTKILRYICFINSTTGFATGDSSIIIKTTNAGNDWFISYASNSKASVHSIYFINQNTGFAYRDTCNFLLKTTNAGENWFSVSTDLMRGSYLQSLYFFNENTGFYFGGNIFKTTNGGINWFLKDVSPYEVRCLYFFDQNTGIASGYLGNILKTTDSGESWIFQSQILCTVNGINFLDSLNGYLLGAGGCYIYKTTDKGNNWTVLQNSAGYGNYTSFDFPDINTGYILDAQTKIIKTTNAGLNWYYISSGTRKPLYSIHFLNQNLGLAVGEEDIVKTNNGGNIWLPFNYSNGGIFQSIHLYDTNSIVAIEWNTIQKSTNGGLNWIVKENYGSLYKASFYNDYCYFISQTHYIAKSTNQGDSWALINTNIYPTSIFFINESTGFSVAGIDYNNFYKTTNYGENWTPIFTGQYGSEVTDLFFTDSLNGHAVLYDKILKTSNGGFYWSYTTPGGGTLYFLNKNTGYVTNGYNVLKTTNQGINWITQFTSSKQGLNNIYFLDTLIGYVVGNGGEIFKTTNGGNVWVSSQGEKIPDKNYIYQNYPNPFNPVTNIKYQIQKTGLVTLKIYAITGREIKTLVNEVKNPGSYIISFNGSEFASGVYFYRIQADDFVQIKKMILIK